MQGMNTTHSLPAFQHVLQFWFEETTAEQHFQRNDAFDATIRDRFAALHEATCRGEMASWRDQPQGRLAEVIVLDQFSRNLYRDHPRAWAQDGQALVLAQEAVRAGADRLLNTRQRAFLYMPYMHSESRLIHQVALRLFGQPGMSLQLDYEQKHAAIIERFGRYPHRNAVLGRASTPEEIAFLEQPNSAF
jgi:uncharacterized protein (DUF924 family)